MLDWWLPFAGSCVNRRIFEIKMFMNINKQKNLYLIITKFPSQRPSDSVIMDICFHSLCVASFDQVTNHLCSCLCPHHSAP